MSKALSHSLDRSVALGRVDVVVKPVMGGIVVVVASSGGLCRQPDARIRRTNRAGESRMRFY